MTTVTSASSANDPHDDRRVVINTSPLLALIAAIGDLSLLKHAYTQVLVPYAVAQEVKAAGPLGFGVEAFLSDQYLSRGDDSLVIPPWLLNSLDVGEAAVVATALSMRAIECVSMRPWDDASSDSRACKSRHLAFRGDLRGGTRHGSRK